MNIHKAHSNDLYLIHVVYHRRAFQLLGFDEYHEELADGIQLLRYNRTTAYATHIDYFLDPNHDDIYDYDTSGKGGNRYATILLYFTTSNEKDGGETVFPSIFPMNVTHQNRIKEQDGLQQLRDSGDTDGILQHDSWEEYLTVLCRTRFAIRPMKLRTILFYNMYPNGTMNPLSSHAACPVLRGTKLTANIWTWSTIRPEFPGGPRNSKEDDDIDPFEKMKANMIRVIFKNSQTNVQYRNVELYYEDEGYVGKIGYRDDPIGVYSHPGYRWTIKDSITKEILQTIVIKDDPKEQVYVL
jgi:hypothetical protein